MSSPLDVITLGEPLVSLAPVGAPSLAGTDLLRVSVAGAEANLAATLARLGESVCYLGLVGDDPFGRQIRTFLSDEGVDVSGLRPVTGQTGLIIKERPSPHLAESRYYRSMSPAATATRNDLDLHRIPSARVLHLTGITSALGPGPRDLVRAAIDVARQHGAHVTFDINMRPALWSPAEARAELLSLLPLVDEVYANREEAMLLTGCNELGDALSRLATSGPEVVVIKDGRHGAMASVVGEVLRTPAWPAANPIDPVGAGDAFDAGWIFARLRGLDPATSLTTAAWVAAHVVQSELDADGPTYDEWWAASRDIERFAARRRPA